jgi:S1-C subfamily serine protease
MVGNVVRDRVLAAFGLIWEGVAPVVNCFVVTMCCLALAVAACPLAAARGQESEEAIDRSAAATVLIAFEVNEYESGEIAKSYLQIPAGSGIVVSDDGLILTNAHVVEPATARIFDQSVIEFVTMNANANAKDLRIEDYVSIFVVDQANDTPKHRYFAEIEKIVADQDLAVLRITRDAEGRPLGRNVDDVLSPLFGREEPIKMGEAVSILGYPEFGVARDTSFASSTVDYIPGSVRRLEYNGDEVSIVHLYADISAGSSGGPVTDKEGSLVGIVSEVHQGTGGSSEAIAIPFDQARSIIEGFSRGDMGNWPVKPLSISSTVEYSNDPERPYHLSVWISGPGDVYMEIVQVTYRLHPTFTPSVVTRTNPDDEFLLEFDSWGEFEIIAEVELRDGTVLTLTQHLDYEDAT